MKEFLEQLRMMVGSKAPVNLLIKFTDDGVSIITTVVRDGKPDVPIKIEGPILEVEAQYFSILHKPVTMMTTLQSNADKAVKTLEAEAKEEGEKKQKEVTAKAAKEKAKVDAGKSVAEKEAEKIAAAKAQKAAKELEKLEKDKGWADAKREFRLQHWGIARQIADKVLVKFPDNNLVIGFIETCCVKLGIRKPKEAFVDGIVEYVLPELAKVITYSAAPHSQGLTNNTEFDNERTIKNEENDQITANNDAHSQQDDTDVETDTSLAEQLDENLSDVEETVEESEEEEPISDNIDDDDNF